MVETSKRPATGRRFWWMLVVLMILLNFTLWQRPLISAWLGARALKSASNDDSASAARYIEWSRLVWRQSPEAAMAAARMARRESKLDEFSLELKRARYLGISSERADREVFLASAQSGQLRQVEGQLSEMIETSGNDGPQICEAFAQGYMRMRDYSSALTLLKAWAKDYPSDARPYAWIGLIHAEMQSNEAAEDAFRTALRLDGKNARAAQGLGSLLFELKRPSEAVPFFRVALDNEAVGPEAVVGLANSLQSLSKAEEAMSVLETGAKRFPGNDSILGATADAYIKQGRYGDAEKLLAAKIRSGTRRRELRYFYAIALRGLDRADEAVEHFSYAAEANEKMVEANHRVAEVADRPNDAQLRSSIGETYLKYGNIEDGLMWISSSLEINPDNYSAHLALADYYKTHSRENPKFIPLAQQHRAIADALGRKGHGN
ncbi:MAG: tetratricopeptide repeat protein [Pirellulaceae bacterium]|nr:tetratricopeptide repeat protein [Pirellulaceae bacterium]